MLCLLKASFRKLGIGGRTLLLLVLVWLVVEGLGALEVLSLTGWFDLIELC